MTTSYPQNPSGSPFAGEHALRFERDLFTTSNGLERLFAKISDVSLENAGTTPALRDHDRVIFSNPYRSSAILSLYRTLRDAGVPILVVERAALPNRVFLDVTGFLGDSTVYDRGHWQIPLSEVDIEAANLFRQSYLDGSGHLEQQPRRRQDAALGSLRRRTGKPIVFVPLQSRNDAATRHFAASAAYPEFIDHLRKIASEPHPFQMVYKPHPLDQDIHIEGAIRCNDWHIDDLIRASDRIVTFNSGVGVLALVHDKPVGVFGRAFYGQKGLATPLASRREIVDFAASNIEADAELNRRFLFHLARRVYSDVRFLPRPFANSTSRNIAMAFKTARVFDPLSGSVSQIDHPQSRPTQIVSEYSAAARRFIQNCRRK